MAPVRNRWVLGRLILTSLLACVSLPHLVPGANAGPIAQSTASRLEPSRLEQSNPTSPNANTIAQATTDPIAADLAPAIAQLKANNPTAAEALLLKLQAQSPDRDDLYQYLYYTRLLQGNYADILINAIDRTIKNQDADPVEPPAWLADRLAKPMTVLLGDPPPELFKTLETRVAADPQAIAPRLAWLSILGRPISTGLAPGVLAQRSAQLQQQVAEIQQRHGQNPEVLSFLTRILLESDQVTQAQAILERLIKLAPDRLDLRPQLARLLAGKGEFAAAQRILTDGLTAPLTPEVADLLFTQAEIQESIGDISGAIATHKRLLTELPKQSNAYSLLQLLMGQGQLDPGIALYQSLVKTQPRIAAEGLAAAANLVSIESEPRTQAKRLALIEQAHQLAPQDDAITLQLIETYRSTNRSAAALKLAQTAFQQTPNNAGREFDIPGILIELLAAQGKEAEALKLSQAQIKRNPDLAPTILSSLLIGLRPVAAKADQDPSKFQRSKYDQAAIALTEQFIRQYPKQTAAFYSTLTGFFMGDDNSNKTLAIYKKLEQLDPTNLDYKMQRVWHLNSMDQSPAAIALLQQILAKPPKPSPQSSLQPAHIHQALGDILLSQNRIPEAMAAFTASLRLDPTLAPNISSSILNSQHYPEAIAFYDLALKTQPNNASLLADYGYALAQTGQPDRAIAIYRQALELTPAIEQSSSLAPGRLIRQLASQNQLDRAIDEAITIAQQPQPMMYGNSDWNPFLFLSLDVDPPKEGIDILDQQLSANNRDERIYQGIIAKLTPKGPSLLLAAAHESLGQLLAYRVNKKPEGLRQFETAQTLYKTMGRPDRVYAIDRQLTEFKQK
jgi:tetratricopeptide (TPR) repeat protein